MGTLKTKISFNLLRFDHPDANDLHFISRVETIYKRIKNKEEIEIGSSDYLFVAQQKHNYYKLEDWRKNLLQQTDLLSIIKSKNAHSFEYKFECAKEYYIKHGNLRVPPKYVDENGFSLGKWILNLRSVYKRNCKGFLDENRIKRLESIGMEWKINNRLKWDEWYSLAKKYYVEYGNLEIPLDFEMNGYKIGRWLNNQKDAKNNPKSRRAISDEQIKKLDEIGILWKKRIKN